MNAKEFRLIRKRQIIAQLEANGINFNQAAMQLDGYDIAILTAAAKAEGYRKPASGYLSLGGSYFEHLKKFI